MRRFLRHVLLFILVFGAIVLLLNTSPITPESDGQPLIIAHRGLGQTVRRGERGAWDGAEAPRPVAHDRAPLAAKDFPAAWSTRA